MKLPHHQILHNKTTGQGPKGLCIRHNRREEEAGFMEGEEEMFLFFRVKGHYKIMPHECHITQTYQGIFVKCTMF